jgi:hypothetical protein
MIPLFRWFAMIFVLLNFGILCAVWLGRTSSKTDGILHFDRCRLPCWIGIYPHKTTVREAKDQIRRMYGTSSEYHIVDNASSVDVVDSKTRGLRLRIVFWVASTRPPISNSDTVIGLEIQTSLVIGDILVAMPKPDSIGLWGKGGGTFPAIIYDSAGFVITVDTPPVNYPHTCTHFSAHQRIQSITIYPKLLKAQFWRAYSLLKWTSLGRCFRW